MIDSANPEFYTKRMHGQPKRPDDIRTEYQRDRARVIHSSAFRRLQGKTQVMGVGEGDFHRTRLTHSIECAQIGNGLLEIIRHNLKNESSELIEWLPERDLIEAACFAHDLGHPPFGHGGEVALHGEMKNCGGFEGNGQTLRILTKLEKHIARKTGIDPTRRLVLSVLKYPIPYSFFDDRHERSKPPKCFYDEEKGVVDWALQGFSEDERRSLRETDKKDKAKYKTLDCSIMEMADDIAYAVHDVEDIVARGFASKDDVQNAFCEALEKTTAYQSQNIEYGGKKLEARDISDRLFSNSFERKQQISDLVNLFVTKVRCKERGNFHHPLLKYYAHLPSPYDTLLEEFRLLSFQLVIKKAEVQQLERRGQRVVASIFEVLSENPKELIPLSSWEDGDESACVSRRICDYVAGMTDSYAEKVYRRLFIPGFGNSHDEL